MLPGAVRTLNERGFPREMIYFSGGCDWQVRNLCLSAATSESEPVRSFVFEAYHDV